MILEGLPPLLGPLLVDSDFVPASIANDLQADDTFVDVFVTLSHEINRLFDAVFFRL